MKLTAILAALLLFSASQARARNGSEDSSPLSRWSYLAKGGLLLPAGDEGNELKRGPHLIAGLDYEATNSLQVGLDFGFSQSGDPLRTRVFMVGGHGRMTPESDFEAIYVQGGPGLYLVTYDPRNPAIVSPSSRLRPGLNFGVGFELLRRSRLAFGVMLTYHGIVIARSDALSYLGAGITVALKPDSY